MPVPFSPEASGYRNTSLLYPCRTCYYYVPDEKNPKEGMGTCKVVTGPIRPGGTSTLWRWKHFLGPLRETLQGVPSADKPPLLTRVGAKLYAKLPVPDLRAKM